VTTERTIHSQHNSLGLRDIEFRYDGYQKPYFATAPDGTFMLQGQPVPK